MKNFFTFALLQPRGVIAFEERQLMLLVVLLMLIAVVPAYILLIVFSRKYRAKNKNDSIAAPQDNPSTKWVILFWSLPAFVVLMISLITWNTTHILDPYKTISSPNPPVTIEVIALPWKWLFIYPEQHIATVNFIQIPVKTPVHFDLTADNAPMTSFWIPQLGGQMYAMTAMSAQINLIASTVGDYEGSTAEINGAGYAGMRFVARATSQADFDQWVQNIQQASTTLTMQEYSKLILPSENTPVSYYASVDQNLYTSVTAKYMSQASSSPTNTQMDDMQGMGNMNMTSQ